MPRRIYHEHEPPAFIDHVYAHPWEISIAVFTVLGGALGALLPIFGGVYISKSLAELPWYLVLVFCGLLVAGGIQILRGLFDDSEDLMVGWGRERMGLVLMASGWLVYFVVVIVSNFSGILFWGWGLTFSTASILRLLATFREENSVRRAA